MLTEGYIRLSLTIIVIVIIVFVLIRFNAKRNPAKSSLDMLKERYENGEITKEDYEKAKERQGYKE